MHLPSSNTTTIQAPALPSVTTINSRPEFEKIKISPELSGICTEVLNHSTGNYEVISNDPNCLTSKDEIFIKRAPSSLEHGYYKLGALKAVGKKEFTDDGDVANANQRPLEWTSEELEYYGSQKSSFIERDYESGIRDSSSSSITQMPLDNASSSNSGGQEDTTSLNNMLVGYPGATPSDPNLVAGYYYDSEISIGPRQEIDLSLLYGYPTQTRTMPNLNSFQDEITYIHPYEMTQSNENIYEVPNYDYTDSNSNSNSEESEKTLNENSNPQRHPETNVDIPTESKITDSSSVDRPSQSSFTVPPSNNQDQNQVTPSSQKVDTAISSDPNTDDEDSVEFEEFMQDEENEEDE